MRDCEHISLMNDFVFFLLFLNIEENKHKFSFISHDDKKQLNVAIMKFKNSSFYIQRIMNKTLRDFKNFCRVYINDIVLFFKIFNKHVEHFRRFFVKLVELRIILNFKKIFLNYFSIILLEQKIEVFDFSTIEKRIVVIKIIKFLKNFKVLKIYSNLTNYQRKKLIWYVQKTNVLQKETTRLLKDSSIVESQKRQTYSRTTSIENSSILKESFYQL